jgi:hypothetical protein
MDVSKYSDILIDPFNINKDILLKTTHFYQKISECRSLHAVNVKIPNKNTIPMIHSEYHVRYRISFPTL